jgi:hypothetical protein
VGRSLLIAAVYQENTDWVDHLPKSWETMVVKKGEDVPNEGREAASFCWAFQQQDWEDDDIVACVQGDPFAHCGSLVRKLYFPPSSFEPLGDWRVSCDGDGAPHHSGLPVAGKYGEWLGDDFPGSLDFTSGGQFFVSGSELKGKDWQEWYDRSCTEHGPWLMERFWREIFRR